MTKYNITYDKVEINYINDSIYADSVAEAQKMCAPKTSAERQKASDERHREAGRVQRKVWATLDEHAQIKAFLAELRR